MMENETWNRVHPTCIRVQPHSLLPADRPPRGLGRRTRASVCPQEPPLSLEPSAPKARSEGTASTPIPHDSCLVREFIHAAHAPSDTRGGFRRRGRGCLQGGEAAGARLCLGHPFRVRLLRLPCERNNRVPAVTGLTLGGRGRDSGSCTGDLEGPLRDGAGRRSGNRRFGCTNERN